MSIKNKQDVVAHLLKNTPTEPQKNTGQAFAPSNIALCKYWGKRNDELNLPINSSLSIGLANKGAHATIQTTSKKTQAVIINGESITPDTAHGKNLFDYVNLFSPYQSHHYQLNILTNIPIAAGLASSACIYASIAKALSDLYQWELPEKSISILARLGSGSACRSIYAGFVVWQRGQQPDGMDSYAVPLSSTWPSLRIGILVVNAKQKEVGSREGMKRTVSTSDLYCAWPEKAERDLKHLQSAIIQHDFTSFGKIAENNALAMHATMLSAWPPINYALPETLAVMHQIWQARNEGLALYFTQDAGPNLKLLFLSDIEATVKKQFPSIDIVQPFGADHDHAK